MVLSTRDEAVGRLCREFENVTLATEPYETV